MSSFSRLFHNVLYYGQCLTTDTLCYILANLLSIYWSYVHRSHAHRSDALRSYVHRSIVLHCGHNVLQNPTTTCDPQLSSHTHQPITVERGPHSLPKPLSDIFETFWISPSSRYLRNVQNSTKMPYKDLTRYKIFLAVSKYIRVRQRVL